jgi:hypothetical protein
LEDLSSVAQSSHILDRNTSAREPAEPINGTYAKKPGFFAKIGAEPQGYFQKPSFSPTLR